MGTRASKSFSPLKSNPNKRTHSWLASKCRGWSGSVQIQEDEEKSLATLEERCPKGERNYCVTPYTFTNTRFLLRIDHVLLIRLLPAIYEPRRSSSMMAQN